MGIDTNIIDFLIENNNGQPKINDARFQDLPIEVDYYKWEKGTKHLRGKLVPFIINDRSLPIISMVYHYGFKQITNINEKVVCIEHFSKVFEDSVKICPICEFLRSSDHYKILKLFNYMSWKSKYPFNKTYIKNPAALAKLDYYRKAVFQLNPTIIYYMLFIPKPFKGQMVFMRIYDKNIGEILKVLNKYKTNGKIEKCYEVFDGYDAVFTFNNKGYITSLKFDEEDSLVSNKKDDVTKIKETIEKLDVFRRMDIVIQEPEYYENLILDFYTTLMSILEKRYKIIYDKDEETFTPIDYIGQETNDEYIPPPNNENIPPMPESEEEEDAEFIDLGDDIPF